MVNSILTEWNCLEATTLTTPGVKTAYDAESPLLSGPEHVQYRRTAAQLNYTSLDRVDILFAAKEICRRVTAPTQQDKEDMKRLVKYLRGTLSLIYTFSAGDQRLRLCTDSDWGSCQRTFRSTSGALMFLGPSLIHVHSRTQTTISLSSAEAELVASVLGIQEGFLAKSIVEFWLGQPMRIEAYGESSAAKRRPESAGRRPY